MGKITVELDEDELKQLIAGILTERVIGLLPVSSKREMAKYAQKVAQERAVNKIVEEITLA